MSFKITTNTMQKKNTQELTTLNSTLSSYPYYY